MGGFIECDGADCPVPPDTMVDVVFRCGEIALNKRADWWIWGGHLSDPWDIVKYRVVK